MKRILDQIELFLLCFLVFAIPVYIKLTSVAIGLLVVIAIIKKENYPEFVKMLKNPKFLILVLPYFFFLIGLINSQHLSDGLKQVEIVTSLLLFPIILTAYKSNGLKYRAELIQSFLILGVITAYLICLGVAVPAYISSGDFNVFFYQEFSHIIKGPHHLSYYVIFAITILITNLINKTPLFYSERKATGIKLGLIFMLSVFLFQLSSKATILIYLAIAGFVFIYLLKKKIVSTKIAVPIIFVFIALSVVGLSVNSVNVRFQNLYKAAVNHQESDLKILESTALRIVALKSCASVINENFWFGTGTGDITYAMRDYYKEHDYYCALVQNIGPHNQFVRTFTMHGVFAFISLLTLFGMMIYIAIKEKHFLLLFWAFIMIVLFCVEDMFGIRDGIIFFSFYTSYLVLNPDQTNIKIRDAIS
ncbi:MAG: O-antigen ligase family protein [Bacteroidales bacterium]|nr:O-antigen ligase family protein [Bacteroidales bacterium]